MKTSENHLNKLLFSPDERERIKLHEHSSEKRVKSIRYGQEEKVKSIPFISWNIGDGQTQRKQTVLQNVLDGFPRSLLLVQECTWKPHDASITRSQSGGRFISQKFSGYTQLSANHHRAVYSKDSCSRYLSIVFDAHVFNDYEIPTEVFNLRDQRVSLVGNRSNICISYLQEKSTGRLFFVVNIHSRRGDIVFVHEVARFISELYELTNGRGSRFVSGVIWAGDFNEDLTGVDFSHRNFVLLMTEDDQTRPERPVDFIGYISGPQTGATPLCRAKITLELGTLKNWVHDAAELITVEKMPEMATVYHTQKKKATKKANTKEEKHEVLNHPIILSSVIFEYYEQDINAVADNLSRLMYK
jgi:hypothetical protein